MCNKAYILFLTLASLMLSCSTEQESNTALIQKRIEERKAAYKAELMQTCKEEMLLEATKIVDSLMIERARANRNNMDKPAVPEKPERPDLQSEIDTTPVSPLFQEQDRN